MWADRLSWLSSLAQAVLWHGPESPEVSDLRPVPMTYLWLRPLYLPIVSQGSSIICGLIRYVLVSALLQENHKGKDCKSHGCGNDRSHRCGFMCVGVWQREVSPVGVKFGESSLWGSAGRHLFLVKKTLPF